MPIFFSTNLDYLRCYQLLLFQINTKNLMLCKCLLLNERKNRKDIDSKVHCWAGTGSAMDVKGSLRMVPLRKKREDARYDNVASDIKKASY